MNGYVSRFSSRHAFIAPGKVGVAVQEETAARDRFVIVTAGFDARDLPLPPTVIQKPAVIQVEDA